MTEIERQTDMEQKDRKSHKIDKKNTSEERQRENGLNFFGWKKCECEEDNATSLQIFKSPFCRIKRLWVM